MYKPSDTDNIDYVLILSVSRSLSYSINGRIYCNIYVKPAYIQYCSIYDTSTPYITVRRGTCEATVHAISLIVRLSNALQDFSLLSVLVAMIILYVSYELSRWFYRIFRLKVCAVDCRSTKE